MKEEYQSPTIYDDIKKCNTFTFDDIETIWLAGVTYGRCLSNKDTCIPDFWAYVFNIFINKTTK